MNRIINPQQIQLSTVKIIYKNEQGTGFFITKNLILTAYHIILDEVIIDDSIQIVLNDGSIQKCQVHSIDEDNDICLLSSQFENHDYLPLFQSPIRINENWETYGFPYQGEQEGLRLYGAINQLIDNEKYDFTLSCNEIDANYNYEGLSGSAVVSDGKVIGVVLKQLDDKIGAVSLNKIIDLLKNENVFVQTEESINEIPKQFGEDIKNIVSNYNVLNLLDESIKETGNWILLEGNPGTGKTLNVASYVSEECLILGKYFTKVPNDDKPKSLRVSKEYFLNWLEETISITITGNIAPRSNETFNKRVEVLSYQLIELGHYLESIDKVGVFFIDGLDEINNLEDFLGIIPFNIPINIKVILSCTSKEILPSEIKNNLNANQSILVSPLDTNQCEFYIKRKLDDKIDFENIQIIALKSEGHPLYLNYLIDFVKLSDISDDADELNQWIKNIPSISGDIINYYNTIWDKIYDDKNKLWICLILSQLRQAVEKTEFLEMLSPEVKSNFYSVFPKISYLIKDGEFLEIYHNSFKEFILNKIPLLIKDGNDLIVKFCEHRPNEKYSITNNLYHYSLSNTPEKAIINCNQDWADKLAINHIEPDLIIYDIKNIIQLSIELEKTTEVIRLLLLLQRIDFRYNSVFVEYAHQIALALIANGKFHDALKYIVRSNELLISNDDALLFLQLFYENEAFEEAEILLRAVDSRHRRTIETLVKSGKGINPAVFIYKSQFLTLSVFENFKEGFLKVMSYQRYLSKLKNGNEEMDSLIDEVREVCAGWNNAYLLRISNKYLSVEQISEENELQLDEKWLPILTKTKYFYSKILKTYNTNYFENNENEKLLIKDIELIIEKYGFEKDMHNIVFLINSIIKESTRPDLLVKVCEEFLKLKFETSIRNINGVDFEYLNYENLCLKQNCLGFLDREDSLKVSHKFWNHNSWENDLIQLIEEIHFLEGKVYYYKSSNQLTEKSTLIKTKLEEIIKSINYTFDYRSYWERSYQLPEQVFPLIYSRLINLCYEFDHERLEIFLESLRIKSTNQLGLYSEGYRQTLHEIIKSLILIEYDKTKILLFAELWEEHILCGVQNRWERTDELLKINEVYGILGFGDKSDAIFQEMLNTSMGPSWYKESQLTPINTTLRILKSKPSNNIIKNFASLLDYASGEMTFQRYVKNNKENFISSLMINDRLNEALEYYKFEVLPNPKVLIRNAEISNFDAPRIGDGYSLGARNITEQNGILNVLENENINPYLKWALCEIFTVNDDIFRYIRDYAEEIANALNEIENFNDGNIDSVCKSISVLVASPFIENDDRRSLLIEMGKSLTVSNVKRVQEFLLKHNINWGSNEDIENKDIVNTVITKDKDAFDLFNDSVEKNGLTNKADFLKEGLRVFEKERKSIWFNNWSNSTDKAKDNIKLLLENDKSVMNSLKENILKFDDEYWVICKELIWFLEGKLDSSQISEIYEIVNNHFHYIVRPDDEVKKKYSWLNNDFDNQNTNDLIVNFIIWHLNHPDNYIKDKTSEVLEKLAVYNSSIIKNLIHTCASDKPEHSTEMCSEILKEIGNKTPNLIIDFLSQNTELINEISEINHFTIKKNLFNLAVFLKEKGFDKLLLKIQGSIPKSISSSGEVYLEEDFLNLIQYEIDELNEKSILDEEFCRKLIKLIDEYCNPLQKLEVVKSDKYLARSFYNEQDFTGRYNYILKHALNNAISHRVDENNIELIDEIINDRYV
ncbi:trypsin-like peptidase domain-containing protein [Flavobacterium covae]|uniref:S1 family peptidase n=1 Tax=Flavobacterium covae TaxID=2906076 RepID=UPI0035E45852